MALLARYQTAMRAELEALLTELEGVSPTRGLLDEAGDVIPKVRPAIAERARLWELAIKIARELGTEIDVPPDPGEDPAPRRRRRSAVDFG